MRCFYLLGGLLIALALEHQAPADDRPNIVVILVDDMGFSDLGCYGGEIETPNLDRLARQGLRFTQFYNCAKCETTRATLLSGRYHSEVGVGQLRDCVTIAEAMRSGGYRTLMTGKWHLQGSPVERGFVRYFGHLSGSTNFFTGNDTFRLDRERFEVPQQGFYTTDANTDYAIAFLEETDRQQPFFLYIAHNAPHYPLQAPREDVEKYLGKYRIGWDQLRRRRHARLIELGLIDQGTRLPPRPRDVPAWDSLSPEQQEIEDLMMATYAGMIDRVDQNLGRLLAKLEQLGELDSTLLLFLSDNGACPFQRTTKKTRQERLMPWDPESYWTYDKGWAHACNTPFREYKRNQHEGGIATPLIAHGPGIVAEPGSITHEPGHLVDIMATCLELGNLESPPVREGTAPLRGRSLVPILRGESPTPREMLFFTFYGTHNALRMGDWKLVNKDRGPWQLYDLSRDRSELDDRAAAEPERLEAMQAAWKRLSKEVGVKQRK